LRNAVTTMVDVMFGDDTVSQNVKIGIVPFNAYVNPGGASSWLDSWGDENALSAYHGAHFFHVTQDGEIDMDTKVNHYRLFDSVPNESWEGCTEARPYPLDEMDTEPGSSSTTAVINTYNSAPAGSDARTLTAFSRAPGLKFTASDLASSDNSRFVPMFYPDEPDCDSGWNGRCPSYHGYSWWNRSVTIDIGGVNTTVNFARYWFADPSDDGFDRYDYDNNNFIDDELYTGRLADSDPVGHYAYIVKKYRNLKDDPGKSTGPTTPDEVAWKSWLATIGADHYYDTDINIEHEAYADDYAEHAGDYSIVNYEEYAMRNAYVGWWNNADQEYDYKYDLGSSSSDNPNRDCPVEILPLSDNKTTITDHMNLLTPNGNTNSANGAMWGWRVVSDIAPFTEAAADPDSDWQKAVVIMTDGQNTVGWRDTPYGSKMTNYGYALEERMGVGVDYAGGNSSSWNSDEMRDHIDEKLLRTCARMKDEGILVYAIVFGLNSSSLEQVFESCATEPNAPYYYKAPTGAELEQAFGDIAADLVDLHISE